MSTPSLWKALLWVKVVASINVDYATPNVHNTSQQCLIVAEPAFSDHDATISVYEKHTSIIAFIQCKGRGNNSDATVLFGKHGTSQECLIVIELAFSDYDATVDMYENYTSISAIVLLKGGGNNSDVTVVLGK